MVRVFKIVGYTISLIITPRKCTMRHILNNKERASERMKARPGTLGNNLYPCSSYRARRTHFTQPYLLEDVRVSLVKTLEVGARAVTACFLIYFWKGTIESSIRRAGDHGDLQAAKTSHRIALSRIRSSGERYRSR